MSSTKVSRGAGERIAQIAVGVGLLSLWQVTALAIPVFDASVGSPLAVARRLVALNEGNGLLGAIGHTLLGAAIGFVVGVAVAIAAVIVSWPSAWLRQFLAPFISVMNAVPQIALAPIFILWFGIGTTTAVVFVTTIVFFLVYLTVFNGLSDIDPLMIRSTRSLGGSRLWMIRTVYIPATLGWLMASLKVAIIWAILGSSLAEFLAGSEGLGWLLSQGATSGDAALMTAAGFVLAILAMGTQRLLAMVEGRVMTWQPSL